MPNKKSKKRIVCAHPDCNNLFTPKVHNQIYCSTTCKEDDENRRKREARIEKNGSQDNSLTAEEAINFLQQDGYRIIKDDIETDRRVRVNTKRFNGEEIRFGVVSDSHLGSRYQQLEHLHTFYKLAKERKVDTIFHVGDISDGSGKMHPGHEYELFVHGADATRDYIIENYPKEGGIKTIFIGGNHDESHFKDGGTNICEAIGNAREDMQYIGMHGAYVTIAGLEVYMHHPSGGVPYARGYRCQKLIEQLAPESKPNIVLMGHLHIFNVVPMYRNVEGVNVGCFQAQTPYLRKKSLFPSVGGLFMSVVKDNSVERGISSVKYEFIPFYKVVENDY